MISEADINIEAESTDKCLLRRPLRMAINDKSIRSVKKKLYSYTTRYSRTKDDRALAIIGTLIIEDELDSFLSLWLKGYKNKGKSFSWKLDLAIQTGLLPKKITSSIDTIREIRNIFAHNLEIESFEDAKNKSQNGSSCFSDLYSRINLFQKWESCDDRETFKHLIIIIVLSLDIYSKHVKLISDAIWNYDILQKIIDRKI